MHPVQYMPIMPTFATAASHALGGNKITPTCVDVGCIVGIYGVKAGQSWGKGSPAAMAQKIAGLLWNGA